MKKLFFIPLVLLIIIFSRCASGGKATIGINDTISRADALQMIAHYYDSPPVNHNDTAIVTQIWLKRVDDRLLGRKHKLSRLKIIIAAYLPTDTIPARRNKPTALIQRKVKSKGGKFVYSYYDLGDPKFNNLMKGSGSGSGFCPPPYGCIVED